MGMKLELRVASRASARVRCGTEIARPRPRVLYRTGLGFFDGRRAGGSFTTHEGASVDKCGDRRQGAHAAQIATLALGSHDACSRLDDKASVESACVELSLALTIETVRGRARRLAAGRGALGRGRTDG